MNELIEQDEIETRIYTIRGLKVMLDRDLAKLYGVETKALKRAVKRNSHRFPDDFMFELSKEEDEILRCQFGTSSWGGSRILPFAFTELGVSMLSSVLRGCVKSSISKPPKHNPNHPKLQERFRRLNRKFIILT